MSDTPHVYLHGATLVGPQLEQGRLVLLGGRRALVLPDGSVQHEMTPTPEPLQQVYRVPTANGFRLIGVSDRGVYRFDEPLGTPMVLAHAKERYGATGVGPGMVQLYADDRKPVFIDVETAKITAWKGAPEGAEDGLAFVSMQNGLAKINGSVMVTSDGGATFRPLKAPMMSNGKPRGLGVPTWREGQLRILVYGDTAASKNEWAEVDFASTSLRILPPDTPNDAAPLLRFVRRLRMDPLVLAATNGLHLDAHHALIAAGGFWANVDLRRGDIIELAPIAAESTSTGQESCQFTRAGNVPWASCRLGPEKAGILRLSLEGKLSPQKEVVSLSKEVALHGGLGGGLLYDGACAGEKFDTAMDRATDPYACVLQPNGQWKTFYQPHDPEGEPLYPHAGPLKSGQLAALVISPVVDPNPTAVEKEARFVVVDAQGEAKQLPLMAIEGVDGKLTIDNDVQEDAQGVLRVVVSDDVGVFLFEQKPGREGVVKRIEGARWANIDGVHGVAIGGGDIFISNDAGSTFLPLHVPKDYLADVENFEIWSQSYRAARMPLSEIGFSFDSVFRVGWTVSPQVAPTVKLEGGVFIDVPPDAPEETQLPEE